ALLRCPVGGAHPSRLLGGRGIARGGAGKAGGPAGRAGRRPARRPGPRRGLRPGRLRAVAGAAPGLVGPGHHDQSGGGADGPRAGTERGRGRPGTLPRPGREPPRPAPASFEVVWVVECSEHLADKARFLASCARLLRPGGKLALCAWLAADRPTPEQARLIAEVCRGMLCPALASRQEYTHWMEAAGLEAVEAAAIPGRVEQTWTHCAAIVARPEVRAVLWLMDARTREFVQAFGAIHRAYAVGAMAYGMFTARKAA